MHDTADARSPITPAEAPTVAACAPYPRSRRETGLGEHFLADLIAKQLHEAGVLDLGELSVRMALAGSVLAELLAFMRGEGLAEVRGSGPDGLLRIGLTERGRAAALEAFARDGYVGPAPVPLESYAQVVRRQSVRCLELRREQVHRAFADTVIDPELLDQLGPALHSGRATFLYGDAGTGKSFIARRLARLLRDDVLVPHALEVSGKTVRCFDAGVHESVAEPSAASRLHFDGGHDPRFVRCRRPVVVLGGELTLDMLDVRFDAGTRTHRAPAQLLANNGLLLIDDLGRQRMRPAELFNRWIVPLEEARDYLSLHDGQHFAVPFDVALVLSTNQDPLQLADAAFLRRIGYKIRFRPLAPDQYRDIWQQQCERYDLACDPQLVDWVMTELHGRQNVPLLPCHPRDLIDLALDRGRYLGWPELSESALRWAWNTYFVRLDEPVEAAS
jgi:hypothetical protein